MYLSEIKISGYKVFAEEFSIKFNRGLTVLIGENGCGKTGVIDAIRLLLNEDEFGRVGVSESHFHRAHDRTATQGGANSIEVNGKFSSLDDLHQVAYLPWLDSIDNTTAYLNKKIQNKPNNRGKYDVHTWGGESLSGIFEWDLVNAISCIYLPPLRDAESKLEAFRGSRLSRLFRKDKPQKGAAKHPIEDKFEKFNDDLLQDVSILRVNASIKRYLKESLGPILGQDAVIQFSEISFDRIVERLRLLFYPKIDSNTKVDLFRDISENSLGYNNILYLATVLAELDNLDTATTMHKILLIEEPEAHLHPQLQIKLLHYLQQQCEHHNIQIILTTHSPTITASCGLNALNVMTFQESSAPVSTLLADCNLDEESIFFLERWLDITKSTLFFAKGILFVEGISEALVIKELARKIIAKYVSGSDAPKTLDDYGVTIINLSGIYFKHFMQLFQGYKMDKKGISTNVGCIPIRCAGVTDCDPQSVTTTRPTKENPCECGNKHSTAYAEELAKQNSKYAKVFTNLKTFEYDLGMQGNNLQVMYKILHEDYIYQTGAAKDFLENSEKDWSSLCSSMLADECFKFIGYIDNEKGEFAQKLAFKLSKENDLDFNVPKYIEDAILWVTNINPNASRPDLN